MAKPKLAIRPVEKTISIPQDIVARVDLHLYSALEMRVPHGAWSRLTTMLLKNFVDSLPKQEEEGGESGNN